MQHERRNKDRSELYRAILALESQEDCAAFFADLCTVAELQSMAQRFAVARLLQKGATYVDVSRQTGASAATISRVNRCLIYGEEGYSSLLARLQEKTETKAQAAETKAQEEDIWD